MKIFATLYVLFITISFSFLKQQTPLQESIQRGKEVYSDFCVTCHLENGEGIPSTFPPLAKSDYLLNNRNKSIKGLKYGQQGEIIVNGLIYNNSMPALGLEDEEIADVMNYILNSWENTSNKMVTPEEVSKITE
ncbi:cytochrome c [uncultured Maribacter sp.]|uniref:c-type cytochrome n=1 Tax=uncultured Maribacter sp. TaxID=431308 RepID=UPI002634AA27|nr:cytochrome c [uncultured Maribacter sp.]